MHLTIFHCGLVELSQLFSYNLTHIGYIVAILSSINSIFFLKICPYFMIYFIWAHWKQMPEQKDKYIFMIMFIEKS